MILTWRHYLLGALAIAVPLVVVLWPRDAGAAVLEHKVNAQGFVPTDPSVLARAAGVSVNTYALASMMASEAGGENELSQVAVAWACANHARARGESVSRLLLRSGRNTSPGDPSSFVPSAGNGHFGHGGRYAVTSKPPTDRQLSDAADVLSGAVDDPTGGADQFDTPDPDLEDVDAVTADRASANKEVVSLDGVPNFRFWRAA